MSDDPLFPSMPSSVAEIVQPYKDEIKRLRTIISTIRTQVAAIDPSLLTPDEVAEALGFVMHATAELADNSAEGDDL